MVCKTRCFLHFPRVHLQLTVHEHNRSPSLYVLDIYRRDHVIMSDRIVLVVMGHVIMSDRIVLVVMGHVIMSDRIVLVVMGHVIMSDRIVLVVMGHVIMSDRIVLVCHDTQYHRRRNQGGGGGGGMPPPPDFKIYYAFGPPRFNNQKLTNSG